ncbi:26S proteasome non-ATPase regulatory subunit 10-like [Ptychodera flava]|uniref:26S proteasome non-ATPase regulatory subunit 10-like n=1 Tax=Ptychodera flava TaxID=63121 RepID=UPI003969D446
MSGNKDSTNKGAEGKGKDGLDKPGNYERQGNEKTEAKTSQAEKNGEGIDIISTGNTKLVDNNQVKQELDLLNQPDNYNYNAPLHIASQKGHNEIVERLVEAGAKLKNTNFDKNLPLHLAAANGFINIVEHLIKNVEESEEGSRDGYINARNDLLNTPLHLAALSGHIDVVVYLVEEGAEVMARHVC